MLAAQWGWVLEAPAAVWVEQWRTWLPELAARYGQSHLLDRRQREALWEQLLRESPGGPDLLNVRAVAGWANDAWAQLRAWDVTSHPLQDSSEELRVLFECGARYEALLRSRGWSDREHSLRNLHSPGVTEALRGNPRHLVLLDIEGLTPLERRVLGQLESSGWRIDTRRLPGVRAQLEVFAAESRAEELESALDWLGVRLERSQGQRVALVARHDSVLEAVVRRRSSEWRDVAFARGSSPLELPGISAALNALEMLGPEGSSVHLSGWLRSPFMQGLEPLSGGSTARFELARRETLAAQLPLRRIRASLLKSLAAAAPEAGARLTRAWACAQRAGNVMPPGDWTVLWREQLGALMWLQGHGQQELDRNTRIIERAFDSVAALGPVLGAVSATRALEELRGALGQRLVGSPLPASGLHVLEHVEDVGPGYAAVWVTGMSRSAWPPRIRRNPLLPRRLQRELQIPWSSREDCFERANACVQRVAAAAGEVAFSYAPGDDEDAAQPAAVLQPWLTARNGSGRLGDGGSFDAAIAAAPGAFEWVSDTLLPPRAKQLRGGAALLDKQASCPLRALIDYRLLVRPPRPLTRGVAPAVRGQILHRAAAHLLRPNTGTAELTAAAAAEWDERIAQASESAVDREFGAARAWFGTLADMELQRVQAILHLLLRAERERAAFTVAGVEQNIRFSIEAHALSARIDRVDRLAAGGCAIIDYKSGRAVARPHWFDPQRADYQMPLYAVCLEEPVSALVLCSLRPEGVAYRGVWTDSDAFPGRPEKLDPAADWNLQLEQWHAEISALLRAFIAGDPSIDCDAQDQLEGLYAPLSRIAELDAVRSMVSDS